MPRNTKPFDDTDAGEQLRLIAQAEREPGYRWQIENDARVGREHGPPRQGICPVPVRIRDETDPVRAAGYRLVRWDDL